MENRITESALVGYLTPEAQLQRELQPEPLTNRQEIEVLQERLTRLVHEVRSTQDEIARRWEAELRHE